MGKFSSVFYTYFINILVFKLKPTYFSPVYISYTLLFALGRQGKHVIYILWRIFYSLNTPQNINEPLIKWDVNK